MTNAFDETYIDLCKTILWNGEEKKDRTGTGTYSVFGQHMAFNLEDGFPLLTTKRVHWPSVFKELIWFINGDTNVKYLQDQGCHIWDAWADDNGDLGPVYGAQWRSWPTYKYVKGHAEGHAWVSGYHEVRHVDQLQKSLDALRSDPDCRRNIVSAWNVGCIDKMALPPCHLMFQWYVCQGRILDCQVYQRSCDFFLGVPFNIASYAALMHIMARCAGLKPGILHWVGGDCHIYSNHYEQTMTQVNREPRAAPTLQISEDAPTELAGWQPDHLQIEGYDPHPSIKGEISV